MTIVLDLARDGYLAIPHDSAVGDSGKRDVADVLGTIDDDVRFIDPHAIRRGRRDLDTYEHRTSDRPGLVDWLSLLTALPIALWALRIGRPASWIPYEGGCAPDADIETIAAARRFRSMRPFIPKLSRCLPHALLLSSYLSGRGHRSVLVIAIRQFPFQAHCWVQVGDIVLTDDLEQTAAFTPIAVG
ncbi:lasso peptide biosynthesis B2 protein [Sphingomonas sp. UYP23]